MKTDGAHRSDFAPHPPVVAPPEDIKVRAFNFASRVVRLCRTLETTPDVSRTLANQLHRSGTSIGANVKEAHGTQSRPGFVPKMSIATKEARETNCWLRLLAATDLMPEARLAGLTDESNHIVGILTTIVKRPKESES